jgi:uncharacterized protein YndB with AHSA1/START domain
MSRIRKGPLHIEAPPEKVWELLCNADRCTEWNAELVEIRNVHGPLDHPGAGYDQVFYFAGRRVVVGRLTVVAVDPGKSRELRIDPPPPGMKWARGRDWLEPADGGTNVYVELEYEPTWGLLGRLLDPLSRPMLSRMLKENGRNLKRLLESEGL